MAPCAVVNVVSCAATGFIPSKKPSTFDKFGLRGEVDAGIIQADQVPLYVVYKVRQVNGKRTRRDHAL